MLGEEATSRDPGLLDRFRAADHAFTIDPVDGTKNFVRGSPDHAVMVAEIRGGETVRSWIWQPQHRVAYVAERGGGAWRDGQRLTRPPVGDRLRGVTVATVVDRSRAGHAGCPGADLGLLWRRLPEAGRGRGRLRRLPQGQALGPRPRLTAPQRGGRSARHLRRRAVLTPGRRAGRTGRGRRPGDVRPGAAPAPRPGVSLRLSGARPGRPGRGAGRSPWSPWRTAPRRP